MRSGGKGMWGRGPALYKHNYYYNFKTVLRIQDILLWIRIRGSLPLTNGSGSCYFRH
jgi:hypothetical protein